MARPTKLGNNIIEAFQAVLDEDMIMLVCTDSQLFFLLNERLVPEEQISYRSFQRYKMFATAYGARQTDFPHAANPEQGESFPAIYKELYRLFTHALINQKRALLTKMLGDVQGWHRYRWILERKFREWSVNWDDTDTKREKHWLDEEESKNEDLSDFEIQIVPVHLDNHEHIEGQPERPPGNWDEEDRDPDHPDYRHPGANPNAHEDTYFYDGWGNMWWEKTGKRKWE